MWLLPFTLPFIVKTERANDEIITKNKMRMLLSVRGAYVCACASELFFFLLYSSTYSQPPVHTAMMRDFVCV